ncbi:MAG: sensor histidine kinase [Gammaproteobacteria bacterium]|nr:sensor histidine kinase [Gammaproteobacteria bacterium]MCW9031503.1 sensor histidine kinase [Gammaproteobacteria bacterium]
MKSIQSRLASGLLISLMLVFLILWLAVSSNLQRLSENYIASRLEHDIETLLTATSFKNNTLLINDQYINSIYQRPFSGHYYTIQHKQKLIRSRSLWDQDLAIPAISNNTYLKSVQQGPEKQLLLTITSRFNKQQQDIVISVAEDLTPIINDISRFKNYFTVISIIILVSLLLIQLVILRTGLRPLRKIHAELSELEKGTINELSTDVPSELESVVNEVNHLSLALYKRLKRSRDALSDLSHAIKKPLTLLQNFSDDNRQQLDKNSNEFLNNQIKSIQHITDRILKQARIAGSATHHTPFDINVDLPLLIKTITAMYPHKHIHVNLNIAEKLDINIDREDMFELLGNLLDNAWKWADKEITIHFSNTDKTDIIIEDDGPGANPESLNELSQRGVRLDESVNGYGFGLAISADIIKDYKGDIKFDRSDNLGGFKITIQLPFTA